MNLWAQRAALLGLAPLLLAQATHTRRVTPQLPEPPGERQGRAGSGPRLRLLIAGDSAAAGVGVNHQHQALSGQLTSALASRFDVSWELIAQSGFTTRGFLAHLEKEPPRIFDIAVISLGVNDLTSAVCVRTWLAQQQRLAALLVQCFSVKHIVLSSLPPVHEMLALPQPLRWLLGVRARRFNASMSNAAAQWPNCELLPNILFKHPNALASDGFHPGSLTYQLWATQLTDRISDASLRILIEGG